MKDFSSRVSRGLDFRGCMNCENHVLEKGDFYRYKNII